MTAESTLGSAVAARQAHTLEAAGSTPAPATISFCPRCRRLQCGPDSCAPTSENRSTATVAGRLPWAMIPALLLALTGWGCAGKIPPPVLAAPTVEAGPIGTDGYRVQVAGTLDWWTLHVQPQVEVEFRPGEYVIEVVLPLVLGDASATLRIMAYGPDPASVEACVEAPALLPAPICTTSQNAPGSPRIDSAFPPPPGAGAGNESHPGETSTDVGHVPGEP